MPTGGPRISPTGPRRRLKEYVTERQKDGFDSLGLIEPLARAVSALGYEEPTPVQRETIPLLLAARDVLGQAATGTGKTAAFALPMLQRLVEDEAAKKQTGGLVLVPTRELAMHRRCRSATGGASLA